MFLFVGGTIARKGFDLLLEAYLAEFDADDEVVLVVKDAGSQTFYRGGNTRQAIEDIQQKSGSPEIVYFEQHLTEGQLASLYTACDCLVAPYRGEGFGLPILEAMACGLAPIVPRGGASDDFVSPQTSKLLPSRTVECEHPLRLAGIPTQLSIEVSDLRRAMRWATENAARLRERGRRASRKVHRDFTWADTARRVRDRIHALLDRRPLSAHHSKPQKSAEIPPARTKRQRDRVGLSLCMIVRDSSRTLGACLESIRPWVDEMVVVDTGSTDDTAAIAARLGARVYHFPWCDDFAAARNESTYHARGEWIFWMDSDDTIDADNGRKLRELTRQDAHSDVMGYVMQVHCPGPPGAHDREFTAVDHLKLFRNVTGLRFEGRIHEQILPAVRAMGGRIEWTDIFVLHSGSDQSPEGQRRKRQRDLRLLELELADRPNHPFALFNLGMTYDDMGEHEKAIDALTRSLEASNPRDSQVRKAYALLVNSHVKCGQHDAAWDSCQRGRQLYPEDTELLFREGILSHHFGRPEAAIAAYTAVLENQEPRHFSSIDRGILGYKTRHNLAVVYAEAGRLADAEAQWRKVVKEVPRYDMGWQGLAETLLEQQKVEEAAAIADGLLADAGLRQVGRMIQTDVHKARGDLFAAQREIELALEESPGDCRLLRARSQMLFENADPVAAEEAIRALIQCDPQDASAHYNLGTIQLRMGRYGEAAQAFRASIDLRPQSAPAQFNLGHALQGQGASEQAIVAWHEASRLAPNDAEIRNTLREAEESFYFQRFADMPRLGRVQCAVTDTQQGGKRRPSAAEPAARKLKIAVSLVSRDQCGLTKSMLESLFSSDIATHDLHLFYYDNASTDQSVAFVQSLEVSRTVIASQENRGITGPRIEIMRRILDGDWSHTLEVHSDMRFPRQWFDACRWEVHDDVAIVMPFILIGGDPPEEDDFDRIVDGYRDDFVLENPIQVHPWLLNNRAVHELGYYDAEFSPHECEDDDFVYRVYSSDYRMVATKQSIVFHQTYGSRGSQLPKNSNAAKFFEKHGVTIRRFRSQLSGRPAITLPAVRREVSSGGAGAGCAVF